MQASYDCECLCHDQHFVGPTLSCRYVPFNLGPQHNTTVCQTLVGLQLDAQNSYLFTYNTFIKIPYMFRALPCSSSGGPLRNCIYAASGIVTG